MEESITEQKKIEHRRKVNKMMNKVGHNEFVKRPTPPQIRARNEIRFGLPQSDESVIPPETVRESVTILP